MAREVAYQQVGNPLQFARLPKRRPEIQLSYRPYTEAQDDLYAAKLLLAFGAVAAVAVILRLMMLADTIGGDPSARLWVNFLLVVAAIYLVAKAIRELDSRWVRWPLGALLIAGIYLNVPQPPGIHRLIIPVALGGMAWLIAAHWTRLCTASPLSPQAAANLQRGWNGYLASIAVAPVAAVLFLPTLPGELFFCTALSLAVAPLAAAIVAQRQTGRISAAWRSLASWLTYDRHDRGLPGAFASPAGSFQQRMILTGGCVMVVAVCLADLSCSAAPRSLGDTSPAAVGMDASFVSPPLPEQRPIAPLVFGACALMATVPASLAIALGLPVLLAIPVLADADAYRTPSVTAEHWPQLVKSLQRSSDPVERECLYMGQIAADGSPLLVPRSVFHEHAHFLGDSGAGKTSLGLAPLVEQLVSRGDASVIVIDLKADSMELLATLDAAASEARRRTGRPMPLKHFTNQVGRSTFAFNPLRQPAWQELELYMRTDILCAALSLSYGSDYGEGYYSSANAAVLHQTIKTYPDVATFRELAKCVGQVIASAKKSDLHPEIRKAGVHVQTVLDRLGSFEALNVTPEPKYPQEVCDEAIDLSRVFSQPQALYFHLSSTLAPGSSPEIARAVTYSLLSGAAYAERRCQVFLVIDEFQRMVARNFEYVLQLARSMGVGVILANQSMQDLCTGTADLIAPIESNCRFRQWFSVSSNEDRERLIKGSGETVDYLASRSRSSGPNGTSTSVTQQEQVTARLSANDVLLASDHPFRSIVRITRGAGYAQYGGMPFVAESSYHISGREYQRRRLMPWPHGVPGSFVPSKRSAAATRPASPQPDPGLIVSTEFIGQSTSSVAPSDPFASFAKSSGTSHRTARRKKS